jgi:hypothetical protein
MDGFTGSVTQAGDLRAAVGAQERAKHLALQFAGGELQADPAYDLGLVLAPGETVIARAATFYAWREHLVFYGPAGVHRSSVMRPTGFLQWVITDLRLAARESNGAVLSIYWDAVQGVTVDLARGVVAFDAADGFHGEFTGPGIAPIAVAAVAKLYGVQAMLEHPSLAPLRVNAPQL